ncbi:MULTISPECIES: ABC transporter permease [unclassified Sphingobium]|uniref:ABC transporter permease n=1 Tax=unclassified Sphingobium TaxID=2611147 RepID=UPI0035A7202B
MSDVFVKRLPSAVGILEGLRVQGSVVGALLMRELHTRYGRRGLGYVWLFLEPMLLAVMVVSLKLFSHERHYGKGISVVAFIILGYTIFIMFRGIWNRSDKAIEANLALMYHRMVTVFDILLARALLEAAASLMAFIILQGLCIMVEMADWPARPLYFVTGFLQYFWFSLALSMIVCAACYENTTIEKFVHPISYILMPLSGAFFMVEWFPDKFHGLIAYWPMASVFEEMRYGWFEPASDEHFYPLYVCSVSMVLTLVGLLAIKLVRRKVELK